MVQSKLMDELISFVGGALAAELVDRVAVKYVDPKENMNIASLKQFGKPSVYIPAVTGTGALVAADNTHKLGFGKNSGHAEAVLVGYGVYSLVKTAGKVLAPSTAAATGMRVIQGGNVPMRVIQPAQQRAMTGYPPEANGGRRGNI